MKKILLFIIGIFAVMSLVSCGLDDHQDSANHIQINNNRFQETGEFYYIKEKKFEIIEDTKTKIYTYIVDTQVSNADLFL